MRVWLVRHGEIATGPGVAIGWSDPPLSATGLRQAAALARRLAPLRPDAVHTSDLRRARQTAVEIAWASGVPVRATALLRELWFGRWEGRRLEELWSEAPERRRAWESDIRCTPPDFGESVADLERRVGEFAEALSREGGRKIVVVAHRGSLTALHAILAGSDFAGSWAVAPARGELVEVTC
jgi:alpha-ribazole phosphatase